MQLMKALKLLCSWRTLFTTWRVVIYQFIQEHDECLLRDRLCGRFGEYTVDHHRHSLYFQGTFGRKTHVYIISADN